jgi:uncharacterized protein
MLPDNNRSPDHLFRVDSARANLPYLAEAPGCRVVSLDEKYSYAFDYARPKGILLFPTGATEYVKNVAAGVRSEWLPADDLGAAAQSAVHRFFTSAETEKPQTQDYWVHLTDSCNLGCFYCYIPEIEKFRAEPSAAMNAEVASLILRRAYEDAQDRGVRRIHFKFAGGEPSLALSSMQSFCLMADQVFDPSIFKITFGMITNGVRLEHELIDLILERNINVSFSIDGIEKHHDRTRHLQTPKKKMGTWDIIIQNAKQLQSVGVKPFFLHTLNSSNIDGLQILQSFLADNNWNFRISLVRLEHRPSFSQRDKFTLALKGIFDHAAGSLSLTNRFDQHIQFAEWNIRRKKILACGSGRNYLAVDPQGGISSCQMARAPLANLATSSVSDARLKLRKDVGMKYLAEPELRDSGCMSCFYRHTCAGGCPQHTARVYSSMNNVSPWCEVYGQLYPEYVHAAATHQYRRLKFMQVNAEYQTP